MYDLVLLSILNFFSTKKNKQNILYTLTSIAVQFMSYLLIFNKPV